MERTVYPKLANVSYQSNSTLEQLVDAQISATLAQSGDPPFNQQVDTVLTQVLEPLLHDVQSALDLSAVLGGSLPFVGKNLGNENIFATLLSEISSLDQKLSGDLLNQNDTSVLSTAQSDIASILSAANLLPDGAATDVQLWYTTNENSTPATI